MIGKSLIRNGLAAWLLVILGMGCVFPRAPQVGLGGKWLTTEGARMKKEGKGRIIEDPLFLFRNARAHSLFRHLRPCFHTLRLDCGSS
jgi:hypothetical protein